MRYSSLQRSDLPLMLSYLEGALIRGQYLLAKFSSGRLSIIERRSFVMYFTEFDP